MSKNTVDISTTLTCLTLLSVSCNIEPEQKVSKKKLEQALGGFPAAKENHYHHGHAASNKHLHQPHQHGAFFPQHQHQHQQLKNHHHQTTPGIK